MKKIIAMLLSAAMILSLGACSSSASTETTAAAGETTAAAEEKTALTIATSPDFPPFEYLEDGGEVVGIEIDILNAVCEKLGMTLEINQMDFDAVLAAIPAGKYDVGASGITVTDKRKENALFTDPYCMAAQAIVVLNGSEITSKADLEGKKIAVQTATTAESYCMDNGYEVSSFSANNDAEMALVNGKVDAWVIDDLTAADMVKTYNEANPDALVILDEAMTSEPYAFMFNLDSEELVNKVNEVLKDMLADGSIKAIFEKYDAPYTAPEN